MAACLKVDREIGTDTRFHIGHQPFSQSSAHRLRWCGVTLGLAPCANVCDSQHQSCQLHTRRSATPAAVVSSVKGAPIRRNVQNPMWTCGRAVSNTITLATDANSVRLPAQVEVKASSSQRRWGFGPWATQRVATNTYGTLATTLDASTETQAKWKIPRRPGAWNIGTERNRAALSARMTGGVPL